MQVSALQLYSGTRIAEVSPPFRGKRSPWTQVDCLTASEWDLHLAGFNDCNLFQTAAFADTARGSRRMSHLLLRRDGLPVAGVRAAIMNPPGLPIGIAYIKHGPFWRRFGTPPDESIYTDVLAAIVEEYGFRRGHMISISPRPHPDFEVVEEKLLRQAGFVPRARLRRPISYFLVNTGIGEEALRASLSQKWRYNLKRAERNQLEIRFLDPMEALPEFEALHAKMVARKQLADRDPLHVLPNIFRQLPPSCSHIVTASHRGETIAGAVIIMTGDTATYLYGASTEAALPLNAGYMLHWEVAKWLSKEAVKWYDLGDGFGKLAEFKQGFVGKAGAVLQRAGEFDFAPTVRSRMIGETIYGARQAKLAVRSVRRSVKRQLEQ